MEWYWWVLIILALAGFLVLKVKLAGAWLKKRKEKKERREQALEDDEN